jgi:hypothetical protein
MGRFGEIAFTPAVQEEQARRGSRELYARAQAKGAPNDALGEAEAAYLEQADSFFLATVSESGWRYVQHRGGPPGFLKVLSPTQIAFPDFRGNRRQRLKLLGRLSFVEPASDPALARRLELPGYPAKVERLALIEVAAFDWNCPQHIRPRR